MFSCAEKERLHPRMYQLENCLWKMNELVNIKEGVDESRRLTAGKRNRKVCEELRELSYNSMNEGGSSRSMLFFQLSFLVINSNRF
jgi:hypothetical protein